MPDCDAWKISVSALAELQVPRRGQQRACQGDLSTTPIRFAIITFLSSRHQCMSLLAIQAAV